MGMFDLFKKFSIVKRDDFQEAQKGLSDLKTIRNYMRPEDYNDFFNKDRNKFGTLNQIVNAFELYQLAAYSDILQNVLHTLKSEIFRNGFDVQPIASFENEGQEKRVYEILDKANNNRQSLKEVLMELEMDLNILDDAYLLVVKDYLINFDSEIVGGEVQEILRVDPLSVEMVLDGANRLGYNEAGEPVYFDVRNRNELTTEPINALGERNLRACYKIKVRQASKSATKGKDCYAYYDTSEILHLSKYRPSKTYGFSPLYSLYNKAITLINMDYYIRQYYSGNKVPKGILTVNTGNADSFWAFWDAFIEKTRKNPHSINPLIHNSPENKDPIKWTDFMRNLQEMQYTEVRNEIRQQIGAIYNVSPIFQNDVSTAGGLNNEGLQITVTNRGVELGQSIYNEKVFPWLFEQFGITDYEVVLKPSEEQDELAEKELRIKELEIARRTAELGIKVKLNDTGDFSYTPGDVELETQQNEFIPFMNNESGVAKGIKPTKQEVKEVTSALEKELKDILKEFDFKRKPSEKRMQELVGEATKKLEKKLKSKNSNKIKSIYEKAMKDVGKEVGEKFTLTQKDKNIIDALKKEPVYQEAFTNLSASISKKLKDTITRAYDDPENFTIDKIVGNMKKTLDESDGKLRTIARTESTKISVAARKTSYEKTGATYKYFHVGPNDNRTTEMSKEVSKLTKNGVDWDSYVEIIRQVSKKHNPKWSVNPEAPITHPNTRHTFIAKRVN